MKKVLYGLLALGLLTACGEEEPVEETATDTQEADMEDAISIEESVHYKEEGIETVEGDDFTFHYYAVLKNNAEEDIDTFNSTLTWYDSEGNMVATEDGYKVNIYPYTIPAGETAFVAVRTSQQPDTELGEAELDLSIQESTTEHIALETTDVNLTAEADVLGKVENTTGEPIESATIAAGLYGENGLLGVIATGVEELEDTKPFEAYGQDVPEEIIEDIEEVETKAFVK